MQYKTRDRRYHRPSIWLYLALFVTLGVVITTTIQVAQDAGVPAVSIDRQG